MNRRILNVLLGISLLLCAASVLMWLRSYFKEDIVDMRRVHDLGNRVSESRSYRIWSARGGVRFEYEHGIGTDMFTLSKPLNYGAIDALSWDYPYWITGSEPLWRFGFQYVNETWISSGITEHALDFLVPWALFSAITGIFPIMVIWKKRRSQRLRNGFCLNCGYDLRATPNRCPECGTIV